jgi:hypothetical protein
MKITKELKHATFEWDDEHKSFIITEHIDGARVVLNKVYAFAFMRFVIRMAQRNWFKKVTKKENKSLDNLPELDDEAVIQLAFCLEEVANEDRPKLPDNKMEELLIETERHLKSAPWDELPF